LQHQLSNYSTLRSAETRQNASVDPIGTVDRTMYAISSNDSKNYCTLLTQAPGNMVNFDSTPWYAVLLTVFYWVCMIVGGTGNLIVLTIAIYRRMQKQVSSTCPVT
jgi:hypothetical protein